MRPYLFVAVIVIFAAAIVGLGVFIGRATELPDGRDD